MAQHSESLPPTDESPPRAFTQGVGTVFQFTGVMLFLAMMSVCCLSSLLSKDFAAREERLAIGWHFPGDAPAAPTYSYPRAITLSVALTIFFGMAMAGVGLGLQAQRPASPWFGSLVTGIATLFWVAQAIFAIHPLRSIWMTLLALLFVAFFATMFILAIGAVREMRRTPPAVDLAILPADYKIPYSHLHQDPPEVRLAQELEQRRQRLAIQQKELEMLEKKLERKYDQR
jgi:hypothetical protein